MEDRKSHCKILLQHFSKGLSITQDEAKDYYGIGRLSARIKDLRELGHPIVTVKETGKNRYGNTTRYARYFYDTRRNA